MSGLESYVQSMIKAQNLGWIPVRKSAAIQVKRKEYPLHGKDANFFLFLSCFIFLGCSKAARAVVVDDDAGIDPKIVEKMAAEVHSIKKTVEAVKKPAA